MAVVTLTPAAKAFFIGDETQSHNQLAHIHAVQFPQQLEAITYVDTITIDRLTERIGGIEIDLVLMRLQRQHFPDVEIRTAMSDIMSKHLQTGEWLFRGQRVIDEVICPRLRQDWGPSACP